MSFTTFLFPILAIGVTLYLVVLQKQRTRAALVANADKSAGVIASRLGLTLVEGDPTLNLLYLMQPAGEFKRRVRMAGTPYGHPVELDFADGYEVTKDLYVYREATITFRCMLSVAVNAAFPDFEVTLRTPNPYLTPECAITGQVGEARLPQPQLDELLRVATNDPRVAHALAPVLSLLATQPFVHVLGTKGRVLTFFPRMGVPYFASAPEEYLFALESIACALEGRPAPAQLPRAVMLAGATP
jgi:hypothetical protein